MNENDWSDDIEHILNKIRNNCVILSKYNKDQYYKYKGYLKYFRIPTIILSAIGSVVSVGFKPYLIQDTISITTCFIGLTVGIVNSIELFLTIQTIMEQSLIHSKEFYLLSINIYKTLLLDRTNRIIPGKDFLETTYSDYCKLYESSELIDKKKIDSLAPIDDNNETFKKILKRRITGQHNNNFKDIYLQINNLEEKIENLKHETKIDILDEVISDNIEEKIDINI